MLIALFSCFFISLVVTFLDYTLESAKLLNEFALPWVILFVNLVFVIKFDVTIVTFEPR